MFGLAPYRVSIINSERKTVRLWSQDNKAGFPNWLYSELKDRLGDVKIHGPLKRSRISKLARNSTKEIVCGTIQTGVNGYASELVDTTTGLVNHQRTVNEAEFIPFFFMLICPFGSDFGILLLQRFANLGAKDFFVEPMLENFHNEKVGRQLRINRLVPIDLAKKILQDASIKTIRLIRYEDAGDVSKALGDGFRERTGSVELVIKSKRDGVLPTKASLIDAISGKKSIKSVFSIDNFEYDSIKLEVELNGRRRIIDVRRPDIMSPNIDITEDLTSIDGHPTWESLIGIFCEFGVETLESEGFKGKLDKRIEEILEAEEIPTSEITE